MKNLGLFFESLSITSRNKSFYEAEDEHYHNQQQQFPSISKLDSEASNGSRANQSIVVDFLSTLLLDGGGYFPYLMLVAFEAGTAARALLLLLLYPFAVALLPATASLRVLSFVALAGLKTSDISLVSLGVLSKFYADRVSRRCYEAMLRFNGQRILVTELPAIMVEGFARQHLGVDLVVGSGLRVNGSGRATGLDDNVLVSGAAKAAALQRAIKKLPDVALGRPGESEYAIMGICKEGFIVDEKDDEVVSSDKLMSPVIFHDGRLAVLPTPLVALLLVVWTPIGFLLALLRIAAGAILPMRFVRAAFCLLGVAITVSGSPPTTSRDGDSRGGVLFVCNHRTLLDPVFVSVALGRPVAAVTYSISRLSEFLSPLPTLRLRRDRDADAAAIASLLRRGDLVVCPEGTTLRTPYVLRFSSLFAELAPRIAPVALHAGGAAVFYGTSARGSKAADPFFFFMNPRPSYKVAFLPELPYERTCDGGRTPHDVANDVQLLVARALGFRCTGLTRRDKYGALARSDGRTGTTRGLLCTARDFTSSFMSCSK